MEFPQYVPQAVRTYISTQIEGNSREPHGWAASLANAEQDVSKIEAEIVAEAKCGDSKCLNILRRRKADTVKHRDMLANSLVCLKRLAQDERMCEAFQFLAREFAEDEHWRSFISSAWAAQMDYGPDRDRLKRAKELKAEIAEAADTLAKLIHEFEKTGIFAPPEFHSIPDLLRKSDNHDSGGHNLHMWRSMRKHILGDREAQHAALDGQDEAALSPIESSASIASHDATTKLPKIRVRVVAPDELVEPDPMAALRYGWQVSPQLPTLLETVAKSAREFKPMAYGMIGAAIAKRESNVKTAYLRAFKKSLADSDQFKLTPAVMKAMAIVATVAINRPDVVVTSDDVRKTPTIQDA